MTQLLSDRPRVSDLRGNHSAPRSVAVLEDPTGRRRRRLRIVARLIAAALTIWLIALILGGVGLSPVAGIPFAHVLRPPSPPPAQKRAPIPTQPTASDLKPAATAAAAPKATTHSTVGSAPVLTPGKRTQSRTVTPGTTTPSKKHSSAVHSTPHGTIGAPAPAAPSTRTTHANKGKHTGTSTGTTTTTTTTTTTSPGHSQTAPGQTGATPPGRLRNLTSTTH